MIVQEYAEVPEVVDRRSLADAALRASAACWVVVMLIGQWLFVYYLVALYGGSTLSGQLEGWNRAHLIKGYIPGDTLGNTALAVHILVAITVWLGGMLQLVPRLRARTPALHKWNGRMFLLAGAAAAVNGLYMVWVRGAAIELVGSLSITLNAVLILAFVSLAWRAAVARDFARHRRWALRAFMVVNGVYFVRILVFGWLVFTDGAGLTKGMDGPMNYFCELGSYLLPLAVLELYWRVREHAGARAGMAMSAGLVALTLLTAVGVASASMILWLPHM